MTEIVDVAALYNRQSELLSQLYVFPHGSDERDVINTEYDAIVERLVEALGEHTHCGKIDPDMFSLFSDSFKDRIGFRPRGMSSYAYVKGWLETDAALPLKVEDDWGDGGDPRI